MSEAIMNNKPTPLHQQGNAGIPFIFRVIWFFLVGWGLTGGWILTAWAFNLTIIGMPLGLWMIDRVPQLLTLKPRSQSWLADKQGRVQYTSRQQHSIILRALYFVIFGWWLSLLWAGAAWLLCATIIGLPIGVPMLHSLPAVTTLYRN